MRRVLMISYYFPPLGGIGSVRASKFARYLPACGWDPVVITPRDGAYHRDASLGCDEGKVVRTSSLEISRTAKRVIGSSAGDTRPAEIGPMLKRVQRFASRWLYRPDAQIGWYPFALVAARRALRERRCDVIFSSSFPITAHLVARRLHEEFRIPWIAEFRDLWTDLRRYDSPRRRELDHASEQKLLTAATAVVTVSPRYARVLSGHGARSVSVVTNGFDPEDFTYGVSSTRPVATYLGTYYADRQDLRIALRVLGDLARSGPLAGLIIRFVGDFPESLRESLIEAGLIDSVQCTGFVSHREAVRYLADSTLQLLAGPISNAFPGSALQGNIAAKVFEYLGSRRPILYVGDAESDIEALIRDLPGVVCVRPADTRGLGSAILSLIAQGPTFDRGTLDRYTHRSLTSQLAQVFEGVSRESGAAAASLVG